MTALPCFPCALASCAFLCTQMPASNMIAVDGGTPRLRQQRSSVDQTPNGSSTVAVTVFVVSVPMSRNVRLSGFRQLRL